MFLVSHDRRFLDNVVTSTLAFEGQGRWREYEGDVQDWLTQSARAAAWQTASNTPSAQPAATSESKNKPQTPDVKRDNPPKKKLSYKEQRELDALPALMATLEAEQARIDAALADGSLFISDPKRAAALSQRHTEIDDALLAAMERQEALTS